MSIRYILAVNVLGVASVLMLLLGGCGGQEAEVAASPTATVAVVAITPTQVTEATAEQATPVAAQSSSAAMTETEVSVAAEATEEPTSEEPIAVERPAWQLLPITNAQTGESFTLADFAGKTVWVEPFATWCVNCRQQLNYVNQARANFGDEVVFIALSVEPNIGNDALVQYANEEGFDLVFAAMSPDLLREIVAVYGQTITNPPATPHFILRPDGSTTDLFTGIEGPEAVTRLIQSEQG